MKTKFSIILPVHNEEKMLKLTLPSHLALKPYRLIAVLDRCTDNSQKVIEEIAYRYDIPYLHIINVKKQSNWKIHLNYLYKIGIDEAMGDDIVLLSQADIYWDTKAKKYIHLAKDKIVYFRNLPTPSWDFIITFLLTSLPFKKKACGTLAGTPELLWEMIEDTDILFDTQIAEKCKDYIYIPTISWNLRPYSSKVKIYEIGVARRKLGKGLIQTLLISALRLKPEIFLGYIHGKSKKAYDGMG